MQRTNLCQKRYDSKLCSESWYTTSRETSTIIGVAFQSKKRFSIHVKNKLIKTNKPLYVVRTLRKDGYEQPEIDYLFNSIVMPNILNGLLVYGAAVAELTTMQCFLDRCKKRRYTLEEVNIREVLKNQDRKICSKVKSMETHPLFRILPKKKETKYKLKSMSIRKPKINTKRFMYSFENRLNFNFPEIRKSIHIKNTYYKKYLKTKSQKFYSRFKKYRNKINHLMRMSKNNYYDNYFNKHLNDSKLVWKGIKQTIYMKTPTSSAIPTTIINNGQEITETQKIAEAFSKYFAEIGDKLASDIPNVSKSPLEYNDSQTSDSFYIYPPTSYEIEREIMGLKTSKAVGPYSIPIKVLKLLQNVIAKSLEILFNTSFSTGIVPENFKLAKVLPVFKKGDHSNLID